MNSHFAASPARAHHGSIIDLGRRTLQLEAAAITAVVDRIGGDFVHAVTSILQTPGRVVLAGTGKSGLVARKISATLASTGTPSFYLHPTEALHGDLGMVTAEDLAVVVSKSGEGADLRSLIPLLVGRCRLVIAIVGTAGSTLAREADLVLDVSVCAEACPLDLVPTASSTAALAMGDALAIAVMYERGLDAAGFARLHPGGSIGRRLLLRVQDVMTKEDLPVVGPDRAVRDVIVEMSRGCLGVAVVLDAGGIVGIITDGDLRRAMDGARPFLQLTARQIMTAQPKWVTPNLLVVDAQRIMTQNLITSLVVSRDGRRLEGIVHIHHLNQAIGRC